MCRREDLMGSNQLLDLFAADDRSGRRRVELVGNAWRSDVADIDIRTTFGDLAGKLLIGGYQR